MSLLLDRLAYLDKIVNENTLFNPQKHKCLNFLSLFARENCKIDFIDPKNTFKEIKLKFKNLMGPKKRAFLKDLTTESSNICTLFGEHLSSEALKIHNLWKDYEKLNVYFR